MIYVARPQEVEEWLVVFHERCASPFWQRVVPGRFKHVRVFAWVEGVHAWVFYDVWLTGGARITLAPGGAQGDNIVGQFIEGASVLKMTRRPDARPPLSALVGFWCVPAVRRLLNLPGGALRPDGLWRDCLANGAEIVIHGRRPSTPTRPDACGAAAAGRTGGDAAGPAVARTTDAEPLVDVRQRDAA